MRFKKLRNGGKKLKIKQNGKKGEIIKNFYSYNTC